MLKKVTLEKVVIPESATKIGELAFLGCTALAYVTFPGRVSEIGDRAFGYYCVNGFDGTYAETNMSMAGHAGTAVETYAAANTMVRFVNSIYGANTQIPFEAGVLRMAEMDGKLYIHTCHQMYFSSDGH